MSLLARFEGVAELILTGVFKKNAARLQPVELAKALVREMLRHKQVSISKVYVPNVYRVFLHSNDWGSLASFGTAFLLELSKYMYSEGQRYGYTFLSKPFIELHADDAVAPHEMFIEVDFDDALQFEWEEEDSIDNGTEEAWREKTNVIQGALHINKRLDDQESRNLRYYLEIIEGPGQGVIFQMEEETIHFGRHSQCEAVLQDGEVSRRHMCLVRSKDGWLVDDLGSTNGTWVNGQRITRQTIQLGDRIQVGQTVLIMRANQ